MKKIIFIIMFYAFVQASEPCTEPIYYVVEFDDGCIHKWSRSVMRDHENLERLDDQFAAKYDGLDNSEINWLTSKDIIRQNKLLRKIKMDSILMSVK